MLINNRPHGSVALTRDGEIFVMRFDGSFNREGVLSLAEDFRALWEHSGAPARWATLADLRLWEGGTEDSLEEAATLLNWMYAHGHRAEARLFTNNLLPRIIERQHRQRPGEVLEQHFKDEALAWAWLASQGFSRDAGNAPRCSSP